MSDDTPTEEDDANDVALADLTAAISKFNEHHSPGVYVEGYVVLSLTHHPGDAEPTLSTISSKDMHWITRRGVIETAHDLSRTHRPAPSDA